MCFLFFEMRCRILLSAGIDGMAKVVDEFVDLHGDVSKRAVERKILQIATKEKRQGDTGKVAVACLMVNI